MNWITFLTLLTQVILFVIILSLVFRASPRTLALRVTDQGWRNLTGRPIYWLSQITPQLYVGGQPDQRGWPGMQARGINAIVNLREAQYDDRERNITPEKYLHLPTPDGTAPSIEMLCAGVAFIQREIENGSRVYIHCASGFHRAPTLTAAYLMKTGLSLEESLATIQRVRPFARPLRAQKKVLETFTPENCPPQSEAIDRVIDQ